MTLTHERPRDGFRGERLRLTQASRPLRVLHRSFAVDRPPFLGMYLDKSDLFTAIDFRAALRLMFSFLLMRSGCLTRMQRHCPVSGLIVGSNWRAARWLGGEKKLGTDFAGGRNLALTAESVYCSISQLKKMTSRA
nr:hypothetical protein CFP56_29882 [Quercus suber]